jgi:two-component system, NtrC family, sensor kinase
MSLSRKVAIIVVLAFLLSGLLSFGIQQLFIMPSFITLEKETAIRNAERVMGAIDRELGQVAPSVADWAIWTDTYNYVKGQYPGYVDANLDDGATLEGMHMNFLGIYDINGKSVWTQAVDLETVELIDLEELTGPKLSANHPLIQHKEADSEIRGIIPTNVAPLLVVSRPILHNNKEGPLIGTLVMGRFLDETAIERIGDLTKLSIVVKTANKKADTLSLTETVVAHQGLVYSDFRQVETTTNWQLYTTIADIYGKPIMTLQIDTARDISAQGVKAVEQSLWVLAATGMLVMLVLWKLLQHAILKPVAKLTDHALRIGENDNLEVRLNLQRKDEVGILAHTFDQMVDRLAETRRRLVDQSYHSGIAEMASGLLHNIGNAITPLNVRLATLQQELKTAPLAEMEQAAAELADPSTPSERRADLKQFVALAGGEMASLIKGSQEKLEASIQQVRQVQEILADQQRFSRSARVIEPVDMVTVINEAEAGLIPEMKEMLGIKIKHSVAECGAVAGARAALGQVVSNILINAAESILLTAKGPGRVTITAEKKVLQGNSMVELCFEDNGAGISPDHKGRLFERGFSTKNREGSGYGLHWSANTLQTLGGRISAESSGIGAGACMFILLPTAEDLTQEISDTLKDHDGLRN